MTNTSDFDLTHLYVQVPVVLSKLSAHDRFLLLVLLLISLALSLLLSLLFKLLELPVSYSVKESLTLFDHVSDRDDLLGLVDQGVVQE